MLAWFFVFALSVQLLVRPPRDDEPQFDHNDWEAVTDWLVVRLMPRMSEADAWNLAQEAIARSLPRGERPWNREDKTLVMHVSLVVTDLRRNEVRRMGFRVVADHEDDAPLVPRAREPDPEDAVAQHHRKEKLRAAVFSRFAASPKVLPVLERIFRGMVTRDEEHMAATGLTLKQVQNAKDQVKAFVHEWRRAWDDEERKEIARIES